MNSIVMTIKSQNKLVERLSRSEGISLTPIIVVMVIMSVMGGVFASIMGSWKISAPATINSTKAYYLAETAAMFALQDAKYRFYNKDSTGCPNYPGCPDSAAFPGNGTRSTPYVVSTSSTETAEFWIERPYKSSNTGVDEYPSGTHRGNNDDDTTGSDDDGVDDDDDDSSHDADKKKLYTIVATGKVIRGGTTVAKRQIKIKAEITPLPLADFEPGVYTEGAIQGNGVSGYDMWMDGLDVSTDPPSVAFNGTFPDSTYPPTSGSRAGIVYQPPGDVIPRIDAIIFENMAKDQGHYHIGNYDPGNNYPNGSFFYSGSAPNVTYITGDLSEAGNNTIYGVYYVEGDVSFGGSCEVQGIVFCEGDFTANGGGTASPNIYGGVIQYGGGSILDGNGNPAEIQISDAYFSALRSVLASINVVSWQEAVSAN
ncbi:MAG: hypothetical protein HON76_16145 [Candidatus Scalindua sp.]|jgi:hypothetical protein|nr:hypothetical protein [Candidatus Scalindua sp.]